MGAALGHAGAMSEAAPRHSRPMRREAWGIRLIAYRPTLRVVWFCHAGGTASSMIGWCNHLPEDWEICIAEYPGRGVCEHLPSVASFDALVTHFGAALPHQEDCSIAFVGHSMGGLVAFEVLRRMPVEQRAGIAALVVSATRAPDIASRNRVQRSMSDEELVRHLTALGGPPAIVANDPAFFRVIVSRLRHDYTTVGSYQYEPSEPLELPIVAFGGNRDPVVSIDHLRSWQKETRCPLGVRIFDGGHFYYRSQPHVFAQRLRAIVGEW
jgi:medium-chain acyl-[acyl-carrier-protein] hydrolase